MNQIQTLYGLNLVGVLTLGIINIGAQIYYTYNTYDGLDDGSFTRVMSVWFIPGVTLVICLVCSYTVSKIARRQEVITYAYEHGMMMNEMNAAHLGCLCIWGTLSIARMIQPEDFNLILIIMETLALVLYETSYLLLLRWLSEYNRLSEIEVSMTEPFDIELH